MELKSLFISSLYPWTKIFFLIVFDSALKVGMSVVSLILMARACIDIVDFITISETKSNGLEIYTK